MWPEPTGRRRSRLRAGRNVGGAQHDRLGSPSGEAGPLPVVLGCPLRGGAAMQASGSPTSTRAAGRAPVGRSVSSGVGAGRAGSPGTEVAGASAKAPKWRTGHRPRAARWGSAGSPAAGTTPYEQASGREQADGLPLPVDQAVSLAARSLGSRSPQSPDQCRASSRSGMTWWRRSAAAASGVTTTSPSWNRGRGIGGCVRAWAGVRLARRSPTRGAARAGGDEPPRLRRGTPPARRREAGVAWPGPAPCLRGAGGPAGCQALPPLSVGRGRPLLQVVQGVGQAGRDGDAQAVGGGDRSLEGAARGGEQLGGVDDGLPRFWTVLAAWLAPSWMGGLGWPAGARDPAPEGPPGRAPRSGASTGPEGGTKRACRRRAGAPLASDFGRLIRPKSTPKGHPSGGWPGAGQ